MGDKDKRDAYRFLQVPQLELHLFAEFLVERAKRLVEQQHLRPLYQRPGQRDTLALAAGELRGTPPGIAGQLDQIQHLLDLGTDLRLGETRFTQAEGDVRSYVEVREYRVVLEHHVHGPQVRGDRRHGLVVDVDLACTGRLEARQHAQQGRLAATRGPQQREELAALYFQVDIVDSVNRAKTLRHTADRDDASLVHAPGPSRVPLSDWPPHRRTQSVILTRMVAQLASNREQGSK